MSKQDISDISLVISLILTLFLLIGVYILGVLVNGLTLLISFIPWYAFYFTCSKVLMNITKFNPIP